MTRLHQIAIVFPTTAGYHEEILLGIEEYARQRRSWSLCVGPDTYAMSVLGLEGWPGDGAIAEIATEQDLRVVRKLHMPVVNLSGSLPNPGLPRVMNDHAAVGRLAAAHLLGCELQNFAYYGLKGIWYSQERARVFTETIAAAGYSCTLLETAGNIGKKRAWHRGLDELCQWLKTLPLPCGLMAVHDPRARMVIDACRQIGLKVPRDVAVIGVGNNRIACEASRPTLSSVARNGWEIGFRAAQLLDRLMTRGPASPRDILIQPAGIVARESTDVVAVNEPDLNQVVRFIRANLGKPVCIKDLLRFMPVSRRKLEHRFLERFGRTPHEYICNARVELAKQLLLRSEWLSINQIATECGFSEAHTFRAVFRRFTGTTALEYRRAHQSGKP